MSETNTVSPLRQRVIEDVAARKLTPTRNAVTSKAASGLPPCLGARPIRPHPMRYGIFSCTSSRMVPPSATAIGS